MIAPGPTLETARLILRPTAPEDLDGFATLIGDPESARFIGGVQPRSMAWRAMAAMAGSWVLQGFSMFSVIEKATGRWVGHTHLHANDRQGLERLCGYGARGALALERLSRAEDGRIAYRMKRPLPDGTTPHGLPVSVPLLPLCSRPLRPIGLLSFLYAPVRYAQ